MALDYLPIFYLVAFSLLLYRMAKSQKAKELFPLAFLLIIGVALAFLQGANALLLFSIVIIFDLIAFTYASKEGFFLVLLGILYIFAGAINLPVNVVAQGMLFGLLSEFHSIKFNKNSKSTKQIETSRDMVQIAIGVVILFIFYFARMSYAEFSILMLIMLGYLTINYGAANKGSKIAVKMKDLERNFTKFGQGAIWLALGCLATLGFVFDTRYIMIIFFAIFIGDALATIVGVRFGSRKLPYNKKKSIEGSIAYFLSVSVLPYLLYGAFAIPLAIAATIAETMPLKIDDNFSVPAALIIIYFVAEVLFF